MRRAKARMTVVDMPDRYFVIGFEDIEGHQKGRERGTCHMFEQFCNTSNRLSFETARGNVGRALSAAPLHSAVILHAASPSTATSGSLNLPYRPSLCLAKGREGARG